MSGGPRDDLARELADLALRMQSEVGTESTLASVVDGAVAIVPGARWAGISFVSGNSVEPRVPSDPLVAELDALQTRLDEGPCLSALRERTTVLIDDMTTESRWPKFAEQAASRGALSIMSFRLFIEGHSLGALNLYAGEPGVFDGDSLLIGELLAQHASVALKGEEAARQFDAALASRDLIGQAKGMLMERFDIDSFAAFELLRRLSQESNKKLFDIAQAVIQAGGHKQ